MDGLVAIHKLRALTFVTELARLVDWNFLLLCLAGCFVVAYGWKRYLESREDV